MIPKTVTRTPVTNRLLAGLFVVTVNLVVLLCLMLAAEVAYRVYRDGFSGAITNAFSRQAPYSDLGTSNWVIDDPDVGYRLNPAREEINRRSVRHAEIAVPKKKSVFWIILLGDSIPAARNGFPDALRESLARVGDIELINAAVPGYTSFQEVEFFKRYLKDTEPDLILWTYCLNDNHRFLHVFDRNAGMLWTDEARQSVQTNSTLDSVIGNSHLLTSLRLGLANWRRNGRDAQAKYPWETAIDFNVAWKDYSWVDYEQNLRELKTILDEQSARLVIVIFPYEAQLRLTGAPDVEYVLKPQRKMRALCEKYGVPCLDPFPVFAARNARGERLFEDGIHLNKAGHDLTAKEIFRFLGQEELIPVRGRVGRADAGFRADDHVDPWRRSQPCAGWRGTGPHDNHVEQREWPLSARASRREFRGVERLPRIPANTQAIRRVLRNEGYEVTLEVQMPSPGRA